MRTGFRISAWLRENMSWPILSVVTFLPLAGVLFILLLRGGDEHGARNARWVALWTTLITFGTSLFLLWHFDPSAGRIPVRREAALARRRHRLSYGRGRHLAAAS